MTDTGAAESPSADGRVKGTCRPLDSQLPDSTVNPAAAVLRALADPTRLQMLHLLAGAAEPLCVCDFTAAFQVSQPTVSHHIAKLRAAGLVVSHRHGIWSYYEIAPSLPPVAEVVLAQLSA